jgi:hypothetical protein
VYICYSAVSDSNYVCFCLLKAMSKRICLSFACLSMLGVASLSPIFVAAPANASVTLAQVKVGQKKFADRLDPD